MADIDEIKANAKQVWPDADHFDLTPGAGGHVAYTGEDPKGFRLSNSQRRFDHGSSDG